VPTREEAAALDAGDWVTDVARHAGCSPRSIRNVVHRGELTLRFDGQFGSLPVLAEVLRPAPRTRLSKAEQRESGTASPPTAVSSLLRSGASAPADAPPAPLVEIAPRSPSVASNCRLVMRFGQHRPQGGRKQILVAGLLGAVRDRAITRLLPAFARLGARRHRTERHRVRQRQPRQGGCRLWRRLGDWATRTPAR